jgi:UDP-glucose 4-epimerase
MHIEAQTTKRVLVTGGAGFIGAHVTKALLDAGHQVDVVDDLSGGFRRNLDPRGNFFPISILDHDSLNRLFVERDYDYVYHLAAYAAEGLSHFIRRFNYQNNVTGSINILNASVNTGVKRIVFTSSIAVYGEGQTPMREDQTPEPEDPYGIAKYAVELDLRAAARMFGMEYVILRPHNVYGEFQNIADKYRNVIGIFLNQGLLGKPLSIFGDGSQTRAFTYVRDLIPIFLDCMTSPLARNGTFNIGSDQPSTVNDLVDIIRAVLGRPDLHVEHLPARREVVHAFSDHQAAANAFGHLPTTRLLDGVRAMATWAQTMEPSDPVEFSAIEIGQELPKSWNPST